MESLDYTYSYLLDVFGCHTKSNKANIGSWVCGAKLEVWNDRTIDRFIHKYFAKKFSEHI